MFIGAPAVFLIGERYYFFINPPNSRGINLQKKIRWIINLLSRNVDYTENKRVKCERKKSLNFEMVIDG